MAATKAVVLILGAGPRVGASLAERFLTDGYQVAVASRSGEGIKSVAGAFAVKADFADPASVPPVFEKVKAEFGTAPGIIIYNAAGMTMPPEKDDAFSISADNVAKDLNINTVSSYVAAQQAIKGWATLPSATKKAFIYTGNALNVQVLPMHAMLTLGMGKSASASWLGLADTMYSAKGFRFFYADERQPDGKPKFQALDGPAHADFFAQLASGGQNVPWHATFVKDQGYVKF